MQSTKDHLKLASKLGKHVIEYIKESDILYVVQKLKMNLTLAFLDNNNLSSRIQNQLLPSILNPPCKISKQDFELTKIYKELFNSIFYLEKTLNQIVTGDLSILSMQDIYNLIKKINIFIILWQHNQGLLLIDNKSIYDELFDISQHLEAIICMHLERQDWLNCRAPVVISKEKIDYAYSVNLILKLNSVMYNLKTILENPDSKNAKSLITDLNTLIINASVKSSRHLGHKTPEQLQAITISLINIKDIGNQQIQQKLKDFRQYVMPLLLSHAEDTEEYLGLKCGSLIIIFTKNLDYFYEIINGKASQKKQLEDNSNISQSFFKKINFKLFGIKKEHPALPSPNQKKIEINDKEYKKNLDELRFGRQQIILNCRYILAAKIEAVEKFNKLLAEYNLQNYLVHRGLSALTNQQKNILQNCWQTFSEESLWQTIELNSDFNKLLAAIKSQLEKQYNQNEQRYLFFQDTLHLNNMTIADLEPKDNTIQLSSQEPDTILSKVHDEFSVDYKVWFRKFKMFVDKDLANALKQNWAPEVLKDILQSDGTLKIPCTIDSNDYRSTRQLKECLNAIYQIKQFGEDGLQDKFQLIKLFDSLYKFSIFTTIAPALKNMSDKIKLEMQSFLPQSHAQARNSKPELILEHELEKLNYQLFLLEDKHFAAKAEILIKEYIKKSEKLKKLFVKLAMNTDELINEIVNKFANNDKFQFCRAFKSYIQDLKTQFSKLLQTNHGDSIPELAVIEKIKKIQNFKNVWESMGHIPSASSQLEAVLDNIAQKISSSNASDITFSESKQEGLLIDLLKLREILAVKAVQFGIELGLESSVMLQKFKSVYDGWVDSLMSVLNFDYINKNKYKFSDSKFYKHLKKEIQPKNVYTDIQYRENFEHAINKMEQCLLKLQSFHGNESQRKDLEDDFLKAYAVIYEACSTYGVFYILDPMRKYLKQSPPNIVDFVCIYQKIMEHAEVIKEIFVHNKQDDILNNVLIDNLQNHISEKLTAIKSEKISQKHDMINYILSKVVQSKFGYFLKDLNKNSEDTLLNIRKELEQKYDKLSLQDILLEGKQIEKVIVNTLDSESIRSQKSFWIAQESHIAYEATKIHFLEEIARYDKTPEIVARKKVIINNFLNQIKDSLIKYYNLSFDEKFSFKSNKEYLLKLRHQKNNIEQYWVNRESELLIVLTEIDRINEVKIAIEKWRETNGVKNIKNMDATDKKLYMNLEKIAGNILDFISRVPNAMNKRIMPKINSYIKEKLNEIQNQTGSEKIKKIAKQDLEKVLRMSDISKIRLSNDVYREHMASIKADIKNLHYKNSLGK